MDTRLVAFQRRHQALLELQHSIQNACAGNEFTVPDFGDLAATRVFRAGSGNYGERLLLENIGQILHSLAQFSLQDRSEIRMVLTAITRGQELDLIRFGSASAAQIAALGSDAEFEEYTYYVAGCVGEFWTRMCRRYLFPRAKLDDAVLIENGVRFGKGLQMVNILRDLAADLREGRCYIPQSRLLEYGLRPSDLLDASTMDRFRPLYHAYLHQAADHLWAGWCYTISLPFRCVRVRLACAWPILIGMKTLALLRRAQVLASPTPIKLSRYEVRRLILQSLLLYPLAGIWKNLAADLRTFTA